MRFTLLLFLAFIIIVVFCGSAEAATSALTAKYQVAENSYETGNYEEALNLLESILLLDSSYADAWGLKGKVLTMLGRSEEAEEAFLKEKSLTSGKITLQSKLSLGNTKSTLIPTSLTNVTKKIEPSKLSLGNTKTIVTPKWPANNPDSCPGSPGCYGMNTFSSLNKLTIKSPVATRTLSSRDMARIYNDLPLAPTPEPTQKRTLHFISKGK